MKIHAGYVRSSTDMQKKKGFSVPLQKKMLAKDASSKGCRKLVFYEDDGVSSAKINRPAFTRLVRDIEDGKVESLRVSACDRLFRSLKGLLDFMDLIKKHSVEFVSLKEGFDTKTPQGEIQLQLTGMLAQFERSMVVMRVKDVMWDRVREGKFCGGQPAYGFMVKKKTLRQHPEESKVVVIIYDKFLELKSIRGVTHWLNNHGYRTKKGKTWATATIKRILWNPIYVGIQTYGKRKDGAKIYGPESDWLREKVRGLDPIIAEEKFNKVQAIIRTRTFKQPERHGRIYLLTGLVRCECGGRMAGYAYPDKRKKGRTYMYYRCNDHIHKGSCLCTGNSITKTYLEELVLQEVKERVNLRFDESERAAVRLDDDVNSDRKRMENLQAKLRQATGKKQKLFELYSEEDIDKSGLKEAIAKVDSQTESLNDEMNRLSLELDSGEKDKRAEVFSRLNDLNGELFKLPRKTLRTIMQKVVQEIVVTRDQKVKISIYEI